ncbi:MAG: phosphoenolpyruvate--protein phosphotransferase [Chloroflexota bacterium]
MTEAETMERAKIGIVIVSHSAKLAEGVQELALQMTGDAVKISVAGGTGDAEYPIGTDPMRVIDAIAEVYDDNEVVLMMDLGSALMSAELAVEMVDPEWQPKIHLCSAPLVEGVVAGAVKASIGGSAQEVIAEASAALHGKREHLGDAVNEVSPAANASMSDNAETLEITVPNRQGIHARPAAKIVRLAANYPAALFVSRNGKTVNAASINELVLLGVKQGDTITFHADGGNATALLSDLKQLAEDNFGDPADTSAAVPAPAQSRATTDLPQGIIGGLSAAEGLTIGTVFRMVNALPDVHEATAQDTDAELAKLDKALNTALGKLREIAETVGGDEAGIFDAHVLMLRDADLQNQARGAIQARQYTAAFGWWSAVQAMAERYHTADSDLLRERAQDILDAGAWVVRALMPNDPVMADIPHDAIVVADDLTPSETALLDSTKVRGIVTALGGVTSHTAIIARSLGIPAVVGVGVALAQLEDGLEVVVDGDQGCVHTHPTPAQLASFREEISKRHVEREALLAASREPAQTTDFHTVEIGANIGTASDAIGLPAKGAEGVGLFRTELLFMSRDAMPTEDEQYDAYCQAATDLDGGPVIIRTLDVGGDKQIDYITIDAEENPFLGYRGVRYWLGNETLAVTQLRAICRASAKHQIRVMFPMVGTLGELRAAKTLLANVQVDLGREGIAYNPQMDVGIMIEVPSAVMIADQLAREVDFVSIGTNDLTQYIMAADRGNAAVSNLISPFQPGVLRAIKQVVDALHAEGKWVGMCGEMAGNPMATVLLVGLGLDELSMSAPAIPKVKAMIRETSYKAAETLAAEALRLETADAVLEYLKGVAVSG